MNALTYYRPIASSTGRTRWHAPSRCPAASHRKEVQVGSGGRAETLYLVGPPPPRFHTMFVSRTSRSLRHGRRLLSSAPASSAAELLSGAGGVASCDDAIMALNGGDALG